MRQHGTYSCYTGGCRCGYCREANATYERERRWARGGKPGPLAGPDHPQWRGDSAKDQSKRQRARSVVPELGPCESCGEQAIDRHHIDGDTGNNQPENIAILCRRCHMKADGRLAALGSLVHPGLKPPMPCIECGRLHKPTRKGFCCNCYMRLWKRAKKLAAA